MTVTMTESDTQHSLLMALVEDEEPLQLAGLKRAVDVAFATDASLKVVIPLQRAALKDRVFASEAERSAQSRRRKREIEDIVVPLLAGLSVDWEICYLNVDLLADCEQAMLAELNSVRPDLAFKHSEGPRFFLGLSSHPDWRLIRETDVPVWFVKSERAFGELPRSRRIALAGIDRFDSGAHEAEDLDYSVMDHAGQLLGKLGFDLHIVHAFRTTADDLRFKPYAAPYEVEAAGATMDAQEECVLRREHETVIDGFAQLYGVDEANVHVGRGPASIVVANTARRLQAPLIVIGAHDYDRWQRIRLPVTAEPLLDGSDAELLVVKSAMDLTLRQVAAV